MRVAAHAVDHLQLLVFRAGDAHHPFGIGQLPGEVLRLLQLDVGAAGLAIGEFRGLGPIEIIANGADRDRIFAGGKAACGKTIMALVISDDADRDIRAFALGADDDALHCAFFCGTDRARESCLLLGIGGAGDSCCKNECGERSAQRQSRCERSHGRPPLIRPPFLLACGGEAYAVSGVRQARPSPPSAAGRPLPARRDRARSARPCRVRFPAPDLRASQPELYRARVAAGLHGRTGRPA